MNHFSFLLASGTVLALIGCGGATDSTDANRETSSLESHGEGTSNGPVTRENPSANAPAVPSGATTSFDCTQGFAEVTDGKVTDGKVTDGKVTDGKVTDGTSSIRYSLGRRLTESDRGSDHAFAEIVVHEDASQVLHLEALARADGFGGHLSITLTSIDAAVLPASLSQGYVEYMPPSGMLEREELRVDNPSVSVTTFGNPGELVEGSFGPVEAKSRAGTSTMLSGHFRLCRSADWGVSH